MNKLDKIQWEQSTSGTETVTLMVKNSRGEVHRAKLEDLQRAVLAIGADRTGLAISVVRAAHNWRDVSVSSAASPTAIKRASAALIDAVDTWAMSDRVSGL